MKIGILTYHRSINNGAFIQCFSLYERISKDFPECDVEVIDYHMPIVSKTLYPDNIIDYYGKSGFITKIKKTIKLLQNPGKLKEQKQRNAAFGEALKSLKLSSKSIFSNDTKELFEYINSEYDIVIAGSDAIWNYSLRGFPNPYFLDNSMKPHKFSYAASCYGMNYENVPDEQKRKIKEILNEYEFIGVRDNETEKFAKSIGVSRDVVHTCDPTVFLNLNAIPGSDDDMRALLGKRGFDFSKPAIGVMGTDEMCRVFKGAYGHQYQIVALFNHCKNADVNLCDIGPFEWVRAFDFFKLTVTSYFHGTLLSLKSGTPVICIALNNAFNKTHNSKVEDFLGRINMSDCYFYSDFSEENVQKMILKSNELINDLTVRETVKKKMVIESEEYYPFYKALKNIVNNK